MIGRHTVQYFESFRSTRGLAVGPLPGNRVEDVHDRADARPKVNVLSLRANGIAGSIHPFVMLIGHQLLAEGDVIVFTKFLKARQRVLLDDLILIVRQLGGLVEDRRRNVSLADVVQHSARTNLF